MTAYNDKVIKRMGSLVESVDINDFQTLGNLADLVALYPFLIHQFPDLFRSQDMTTDKAQGLIHVLVMLNFKEAQDALLDILKDQEFGTGLKTMTAMALADFDNPTEEVALGLMDSISVPDATQQIDELSSTAMLSLGSIASYYQTSHEDFYYSVEDFLLQRLSSSIPSTRETEICLLALGNIGDDRHVSHILTLPEFRRSVSKI